MREHVYRDLFVSLHWRHPPGKPLFSEAASQRPDIMGLSDEMEM